MPIGEHVTRCSYCGVSYICGDCITNDCNHYPKTECAGYLKWLADIKARVRINSPVAYFDLAEVVRELEDAIREIKFLRGQLRR